MTQGYDGQMKQASLDFWEYLEKNTHLKQQFNETQLAQLKKGEAKIEGCTWHHNGQSAPNNMQLVPFYIHKSRTVPHTGQHSIEKGNK